MPRSAWRERLLAWTRRGAMITLYASMWVLVLATLPLGALVAAAVDWRRGDGRWATLRCLAFALLYLTCEVVGVVAAFAIWVGGGVRAGRGRADSPAARLTGLSDAYLRANFRLQCWWARCLFHGAERIFHMRTIITGDDAVDHGPFLLFLRHASIGDTVLPAVLIADRHDIMLRYVMKRELLWDPCLDIVGNRLPNYFVHRGSGDSAREVAAVQRLLDEIGPHDGVLIYPEGTRVSAAKRARIVARLRGAMPPRLLALAEQLRHTLPPRLGGPLGLLERNPGLDAVFCAHTGFEGAATFRDLLGGALVRREVRVAFWRVPFAQIPLERDARAEWLYQHWRRIDDWIDAVTGPGAAPARSGVASV
ncbi:MAG TPA: 1-acyl-sn-glycerol-3-phosphate acyltransferase [Candidatus Dormibacteraeota bacterium]|nr:1-acyl-sn-glycerol-3-phosphate acyltransferase [Candidatus Dormibacteraeota bacterium]